MSAFQGDCRLLTRLSLPILALLAMTGCASQPTVTAMVEGDAQPEAEDIGNVVEPWGNPIKITRGEPAPRRTATDILREANAGAATTVLDGSWEGAKLRYRWVDGKTYDVVAAKDKITTLKLFPGEGFVNYAYGRENFGPEIKATWSGTRDQKAMAYGPAQTAIPITPWEIGRCTDLTIYTTWRDILINLCSTTTNKPYNRSVEWWMPGEELRRFADALKSGEIAAPTIEPATGIPQAEVRARYQVKGSAPDGWSAQEWLAFNDGKKTYVVPPVGLPFTPVPAVRNAGGGDTPEYRTRQRLDQQGSYYQISALPPELLMVYGSETLTLSRAP